DRRRRERGGRAGRPARPPRRAGTRQQDDGADALDRGRDRPGRLRGGRRPNPRGGARVTRTLITGGEIVTAGGVRRADVLIEGETIAAIGSGLPADGAQTIDAAGCVVLPGLIDNHTHLAMPTSGTVT